jgi:predicted metal-dependent hydrolase
MPDAHAQLQRGIDLFNAGYFWEAHEAWELAWIPDRHGPDRNFYKGLIQIAAGYLHARRGNRRGALIKWRSGADFLREYGPEHRGVQLTGLIDAVDTSVMETEASGEVSDVTPPFIRPVSPG